MNQGYENDMQEIQEELFSRPMTTQKLNQASYTQDIVRSIEFNPTYIEDEDYYKEQTNLDLLAIKEQRNKRVLDAFLKAKNDKNSIFYTPERLSKQKVKRIDLEKFEELRIQEDISASRLLCEKSAAYNFFQLQPQDVNQEKHLEDIILAETFEHKHKKVQIYRKPPEKERYHPQEAIKRSREVSFITQPQPLKREYFPRPGSTYQVPKEEKRQLQELLVAENGEEPLIIKLLPPACRQRWQ